MSLRGTRFRSFTEFFYRVFDPATVRLSFLSAILRGKLMVNLRETTRVIPREILESGVSARFSISRALPSFFFTEFSFQLQSKFFSSQSVVLPSNARFYQVFYRVKLSTIISLDCSKI